MNDTVIDPDYYTDHEFARGDVIFYDTTKLTPEITLEKSISRIVALPGETIEIRSGQIYVDNKKLETFYGKALRLGSDIHELKNELKKKNLDDNDVNNLKTLVEFFDKMNYEPVSVPTGYVYTMDDDWFRGIDSRYYGLLDIHLGSG